MIPPIQPLTPPWKSQLLQAVRLTTKTLTIVSPFLKAEVLEAVHAALLNRGELREPLHIRLLTRIRAEDLRSGASDLHALSTFLSWPQTLPSCTVSLRAIDNLHAKVWLIDQRQVLLGSGNATPSGLEYNLEYGVMIHEAVLVQHICQDWEQWWQQASVIAEQDLNKLQSWLEQERKELQVIERDTHLQKQAIYKRIGNPPRIGQRLMLQKERTAKIIPQQPQNVLRIEESKELMRNKPESPQKFILSLSREELREGLRWILPLLQQEGAALHPLHTFVNFIWTTNLSHLHMIWADGKRTSRAIVPLFRQAHLPAGGISIKEEDIMTIWQLLSIHKAELFNIICQPQNTGYYLSLESPQGLSEIPLCSGSFTLERIVPLTRLVSTFHVHQGALFHALTSLKQANFSSTINIRVLFHKEQTLNELTLTYGRKRIAIPIEPVIISGTYQPITISLDASALWQVIESNQQVAIWEILFNNWNRIIQFSPFPSTENITPWIHQFHHNHE